MTEERSKMWAEYYRKMQNSPPRPLLLKTLETHQFPKNPTAIDIGSGQGRDAFHLLKNGWKVFAVERESTGIEMLKAELPPEAQKNLEIIQLAFEDIKELPSVDFVYASLSLPFCKKEFFPDFWTSINNALNSRGVFAGNFFGPNDDWVREKSVNGHSEAEIRELLKDFEIKSWKEEDQDGPTAVGPSKHWHIFTVIAEKKTV